MTLSINPLSRPGRLAAVALMTAVLAACGGGGGEVTSPSAPPTPAPAPVDPLASFTQQKLEWKPCDPTLLGEGPNSITALGGRVTCTLMRAPLDYAKPELGELKVAMLKVQSEQPAQRKGAILVNPGGPGADGLTLPFRFSEFLALGNVAEPKGRLLKEMSNRYDLVGFSPRGTGAGTTLTCVSPVLLELESDLTFDRSPQNIKNAQTNARLQADACAKNPLTPYITTDATVRDMDLMRGLLGDDKLNFIGISYGTWLGSWYARVFPERVGRMLLDSNMNVVGSYDDAQLLTEFGRQRTLDEVILPYAARQPQRFNLGSDVGQIKGAIVALPPALKSLLMTTALNLNNTQDFERNVLRITAAVGVQALRQQMPQAEPSAFVKAINQHTFTPGPDNAEVIELAQKFAPSLFSQTSPRRRVFLDPSGATRQSIICNDLPTLGDEQRWVDIGNDYANLYPLTGGGTTANICLYWPKPTASRPSLDATKVAPILFLQSQFDSPTPLEGALKTLAAFPNASMVVVNNEYTHGVFPYDDSCADRQVADYFVNGTLPARTGSCAGKPLAGDIVAPAARLRSAAPVVSPYTDPVKAQEAIRRIRAITRGTKDQEF